MSIKETDQRIRREVLDALDWEPGLSSGDIGVAAVDSIVTLTGTVHSFLQKRTAETCALRVSGVRGVANELDVRLPIDHCRSDADLARAVVRALEWRSGLPHDAIRVKVRDGWVTLEGSVAWNFQREDAADTIRPLTGVRGLTNALTVAPRCTPSDIRARIRRALGREVRSPLQDLDLDIDGGTDCLHGTVHSWVERRDAERAAWSAPGITDVVNKIQVVRHVTA